MHTHRQYTWTSFLLTGFFNRLFQCVCFGIFWIIKFIFFSNFDWFLTRRIVDCINHLSHFFFFFFVSQTEKSRNKLNSMLFIKLAVAVAVALLNEWQGELIKFKYDIENGYKQIYVANLPIKKFARFTRHVVIFTAADFSRYSFDQFPWMNEAN